MLWLIVFVFLFLLSMVIVFATDKDNFFALMFPAFIFFVLFIVLSINGIWVYPILIEEKTQVAAIQSEISSIRQAHYKESKNGSLVGGSLDNMKQSTVLSEYIKAYALKKANYNGRLSYVKTKMGKKVFWWLSNTAFISDDVLKLEEIK